MVQETPHEQPAKAARRLSRGDRHEQILGAATAAFSAAGFAATSVDDVAAEAGVTRAILYRHFESKADLYRAVIERARGRLAAVVGPPDYDATIIDALLRGAAADPQGFRLLFSHAAREPEFRAEMEQFGYHMYEMARRHVFASIRDPAWADWAARLVPAVTTAAIIAWLDAGQPQPDAAPTRIRAAVTSILDIARDDDPRRRNRPRSAP